MADIGRGRGRGWSKSKFAGRDRVRGRGLRIYRISRNCFLNNHLFKFLGLPFLPILLVENGEKWKNHQFSSQKSILNVLKIEKNPRRDHPDPSPDGRGRGRGEAKMDGRVGVGVGVRKNC